MCWQRLCGDYVKGRISQTVFVDHKKQHEQLNTHTGVIGIHGGDHAVYHAIAEVQTGR